MNGLRSVTVITGASAGIGAALARVFARNGHELTLVARREDRLRALADEIAATGGPGPLVIVADVQRSDAVRVIGKALAGFLPGPGMAVYYATKAYVLSFSEALHSELKSRGVRVSVLCPGPVPTEFAVRAGISENLAPGILTQSAERVAEAGYRGLMRGQRTIVPGVANRLTALLIRAFPRRLLLAVVDRRQRRRRSAQKS
jgi:short-subunit dehydrogenase